MFRDPGSSEVSHYIITIQPSRTSRRVDEKRFASRRVFDMVWEKHLSRRLNLMEEFHSLFLASPIAATSAGWVFEHRMHQLLATGGTFQLFPIRCHLANTNVIYTDYAASIAKRDQIEVQWSRSEEHPLVKKAKLKAGYYYRPEASNFPTFDSFRLIKPPNESPILLAFQITRNKKAHDAKLVGLRRIAELVLPKDTRSYLVVVTPQAIRPKIMVPMEHFPALFEEADQTQDEDMDTSGGGDEGKDEGKGGGKGEDEDIYGDEDEDEGEGEGGGETSDEEEDEDADGDQSDDLNAALWEFLRVFHLPIDMDNLFNT